MTLSKLNSLSPRDAVTFFRQCCGSVHWANAMAEMRPFTDASHLYSTAEEVWAKSSEDDWKEAFTHHPKIGDIKSLRKKFASTAELASGEQSGVNSASEKTLKALAEGNRLYEAKFGYIFIVCATGKSAGEMLAILNERLNNIPSREIKIAAGEQAKITKIRLEKLLTE
jgi:2-oxo-4-hydroxy-4-carboxy-5-ureidoimidazoline decarboxylase